MQFMLCTIAELEANCFNVCAEFCWVF